MKDEDYDNFRYQGQRLEGGIRTAVQLWCTDPAAAKTQYGPIASWDTPEIAGMHDLFDHRANFHDDLSRWDVSKGTTMTGMCRNATSVDQQLGGAWARSKAAKIFMFNRSPGSIEGKTNGAGGTPM